MSDPEPGSSAGPNRLASDRLDSWKAIASYLGRGVTTVQRWEEHEALPIHRLPHAKKGSVFAYKDELDAWLTARAQSRTGSALDPLVPTELSDEVPPQRSRAQSFRGIVLATAAVVAVIAAGLAVVLTLRRVAPPGLMVSDPIPLAPRPFANDGESEIAPSLSPDGDEVVYARLRDMARELYIKPVAGGPARRLPTGTLKSASYPAWSPRGDLIAFLSPEENDRRGIYLVAPTGDSLRRVGSASGIGLCWMPDGNALGFVDRNATGEPHSIYVISLATGERQRLTIPPAGSFGDTYCAFSSDGQQLAVVRHFSRYQSDLCLIDLRKSDDGTVERLTFDHEGMAGLTFTPDGRTIVFGSHSGLWEISTETGSSPVRVVGFGGGAAYPAFAPPSGQQAARLVYQHDVEDANIWRWDEGTGGQHMLRKLVASTWFDSNPAFSPDSERIAFASNRTGTNEIWVADADGSNPQQVTFHRGPIVISPQWSPDGRRLAYSSQVGGNRDIYITPIDGSQSTRLTWEPSHEESPSWSRDGRWVYFRSDRRGVGQIWKVPAEGGTAVRVTVGEASQSFESPDGKLLYFVRGMDVPGLWSVPVGGGTETFVLRDVSEAFWGVAEEGIAFLVSAPALSPNSSSLRFFSFRSGQMIVMAELSAAGTQVLPGFSVARKARSVMWVRFDSRQNDLMLIDRWNSVIETTQR